MLAVKSYKRLEKNLKRLEAKQFEITLRQIQWTLHRETPSYADFLTQFLGRHIETFEQKQTDPNIAYFNPIHASLLESLRIEEIFEACASPIVAVKLCEFDIVYLSLACGLIVLMNKFSVVQILTQPWAIYEHIKPICAQ